MKQCSENYADMLRLHRPVSGKHARMDRVARGAQFAPFAALTGYFDLIREQEWKAQERFKKTARESFDA